MTASTLVSGANIIVLGILIAVYAKMYSTTKAQLPISMIFFSALLFLHNVIAVYAYFSMTELYAPALLPYFIAIHVAELAGILILLRISLQ